MALQAALRFIQAIREEERLQRRVRALGHTADLSAVVQLGAQAGFEFTAEELRTAFKHDWVMRWLHHQLPQ
jgi:predicted ribosomally synthesized peptide with nif11-like leader